MKILSVKIERFRSIKKATITLQRMFALVGANNAGKSHVLRALNAFFNFEEEKESFINESHRYSKNSRPAITVVFTDIPAADIYSDFVRNGRLTIKFSYRWDRKNPTYEVILGSQERKSIDIEEFRKLIAGFEYIYIPIIRNYDAVFSSSSGIAYKLLKQIFSTQTFNRNTIQPIADRLVKKVEDSIYRPALSKIQEYYPFSKSHKFDLHTYNADLIDLILKNVTLLFLEDSQENSIENCGSGIQSAIYFAISIAISFVKDKDFLVGIDEPELNMHPQAQRQLIESLKNADKYPRTSFIVTTHSTVIIDRLGHEAIALCRKTKDSQRAVVTEIFQTPSDFLRKYSFDEERYYNFFDFKNSDFFFSKYIIITESPNDCKVIQTVLKISGIDIEEEGISLIPADGEKNIKYPYVIAKELGIPFLCVVDRDVFQPYLRNIRKDSLDDDGIPQYKNEIKTSSPILELIEPEDQEKILNAYIMNKYDEALSILWKYHIVSMRYALEVDLITCPSYCKAFYTALNLSNTSDLNEMQKELLFDYDKKVKGYVLINQVLNAKKCRNLPKSFKAVVKHIREMIE